MNSELKTFAHCGPISVLVTLTILTVSCTYCLQLSWPLLGDRRALAHALALVTWLGIVLYNMLSAIIIGPGFVPFSWKPADSRDEKYLQYCKICKSFKAPRSHHCRRCGRCVLKMDHHCPWINNCCGHRNHVHFICFLVFGIIAACHACFMLGSTMYRTVFVLYHLQRHTEPIVPMSTKAALFSLFSLGLAIGAFIGMSALLFVQMRLICRNQTAIESYIVLKAKKSRRNDEGEFVFPYDLGLKKNLKQFFFPDETYDGFDWPIRDGCQKYDLTSEQMRQKEDKMKSSRKYRIIADYSGTLFPFTIDYRAAFTPPCFTDDQLIAVRVGDEVIVSRSKRHWFYGEIQNDTTIDGEPIRGWFPRCCANENINCEDPERHKKTN